MSVRLSGTRRMPYRAVLYCCIPLAVLLLAYVLPATPAHAATAWGYYSANSGDGYWDGANADLGTPATSFRPTAGVVKTTISLQDESYWQAGWKHHPNYVNPISFIGFKTWVGQWEFTAVDITYSVIPWNFSRNCKIIGSNGDEAWGEIYLANDEEPRHEGSVQTAPDTYIDLEDWIWKAGGKSAYHTDRNWGSVRHFQKQRHSDGQWFNITQVVSSFSYYTRTIFNYYYNYNTYTTNW